MKRKRIALEEERAKEILNQNVIRVKKESGDYFFEIGKEVTGILGLTTGPPSPPKYSITNKLLKPFKQTRYK